MWPQHLYIVLEIKQHIMWSTRLCCWKKHMSYKTIIYCLILLKNYVSYKKISCLLFVCLCNWRCKTRKSLLRLPPWARKPLGDMDLSNGFERPSSKGAKLLFPVIKANKINPLGPPFKLFQCNYVSYDIKWHIYPRNFQMVYKQERGTRFWRRMCNAYPKHTAQESDPTISKYMGRRGLTRRHRWRTSENKCMCK